MHSTKERNMLRTNNYKNNKKVYKFDWEYIESEDQINKDELDKLLHYITPEIKKDLDKVIEKLRKERDKVYKENPDIIDKGGLSH